MCILQLPLPLHLRTDGRKKNNMRKIKGLKVPLRYYDIERKIRKIEGINLSEKEGIEYIKNLVSSIISNFNISVVYDTFEIDKNEILKRFIQIKKSNYVSCGFLTFGSYIESKKNDYDEIEKRIFDVIVDVHSKTAFDIIKDMISEEAKKERLSTENIITVYNPITSEYNNEVCEFIFKVINLKEGLIEYNNGIIKPLYSWAFLLPWVSSKK